MVDCSWQKNNHRNQTPQARGFLLTGPQEMGPFFIPDRDMKPNNHPPLVAIQGIPGSFHYDACMLRFGEKARVKACMTFRELAESVTNKEASHGLMAVENSLAGSILQNFSIIRDSGLKVTGELFMRISQNLLVLPGQESMRIKQVQSHPMAIAQCIGFFEQHPHIQITETVDTAISAKKLAQDKTLNTGVIGSESAARLYGLDIIMPGIETHKENYTRFLVLENNPLEILHKGEVKVCLALVIAHKAGSLASLLSLLAQHEANLTMIQSLPLVGQSGSYIFHTDMIMPNLSYATKAIEILRIKLDRLWVMGVFPATNRWGSAIKPVDTKHRTPASSEKNKLDGRRST